MNRKRKLFWSRNGSRSEPRKDESGVGVGVGVGVGAKTYEVKKGVGVEQKNFEMEPRWSRSRVGSELPISGFLYTQLNETMRWIGSEKHEQVWRSKISTLGPFCLLLWDNPFNSKMVEPGTKLYRGTQLSEDLITSFKDDLLKDPRPWRSFQAFTSCTRNRNVAEMYGNVLFIMETRIAFTADLQSFSNISDEEEELLFPGVSFTINRVERDEKENKTLVYIILQQRRNGKST